MARIGCTPKTDTFGQGCSLPLSLRFEDRDGGSEPQLSHNKRTMKGSNEKLAKVEVHECCLCAGPVQHRLLRHFHYRRPVCLPLAHPGTWTVSHLGQTVLNRGQFRPIQEAVTESVQANSDTPCFTSVSFSVSFLKLTARAAWIVSAYSTLRTEGSQCGVEGNKTLSQWGGEVLRGALFT